MESLQKLIDICNEFKKGMFDTMEFQKRIETVYLPDKCKHTLEKTQHNAFNRLEIIIYSYVESQKKYADEVADELIRATLAEQERFMVL